MTTDEKIKVEGDSRSGKAPAAEETSPWWLSPRGRIFAPRQLQAPVNPARERSANRIGPSTSEDPAEAADWKLRPFIRPRPFFGKRGFSPVYQWEGVVEEVNGEGFRARLRPLEGGPAERSRIEYADFDYDDLADESDHDLVAEGAVFYWTVGKTRNMAGTQMNTSLVRFRRLPPPSSNQLEEASREADALLADLREDQ